MIGRMEHQLNRSWAILLLLALAGAMLAMLAGRSPVALAPVFVVSVFKSRLIILDFMGFRNTSRGLQFCFVAWSLTIALAAIGKLLVTGTIAN